MPEPRQDVGDNRAVRAVGTAVRGNATAFGFSITITATFGLLSHFEGAPNVLQLFLFAVSAAGAIAVLEGAVTLGFRAVIKQTSQEVRMTGTAMDMVSVAAGLAAALGMAELLDETVAWAAGAFVAPLAFIAAESLELMLAERIQAARGAPVHEAEESED